MFAPADLVRSQRGAWLPLNEADQELLSLCDGHRTVADVVAAYHARNELEEDPTFDEQLRRSLGYWLDQAVIERASTHEPDPRHDASGSEGPRGVDAVR